LVWGLLVLFRGGCPVEVARGSEHNFFFFHFSPFHQACPHPLSPHRPDRQRITLELTFPPPSLFLFLWNLLGTGQVCVDSRRFLFSLTRTLPPGFPPLFVIPCTGMPDQAQFPPSSFVHIAFPLSGLPFIRSDFSFIR